MAPPSFAHITLATDGSPSARAALAAAIDLAKCCRAELTVLAIAPIVPVYLPSTGPYLPPTAVHSEIGPYRRLVASAVRKARTGGVRTVIGLVREGVVVDEILAYLETTSTDLIIVGSRGLSAAKRLLIGSVSSALVTHAPCPVLVVRPERATPPAGG